MATNSQKSDSNSFELSRLLSALVDGSLSNADLARLDELLQTDAEARETYRQFIDLHEDLRDVAVPSVAGISDDLDAAQTAVASSLATRKRQEHNRRLKTLALSIAGSLLAVAAFWGLNADSTNKQIVSSFPPNLTKVSSKKDYVATVIQSEDASWSEENSATETKPIMGSRIPIGSRSLKQGQVVLAFEGGSLLILEGPAEFSIDGPTSATIQSGRVLFEGDGTGPPFLLRTPSADHVNFGTKYLIDVQSGNEELHVFEGEVRRSVSDTLVDRLMAGDARRYADSSGRKGKKIVLSANLVSKIDPTKKAAGETNLLASEDFEYNNPQALEAGEGNAGKGWLNAWRIDANNVGKKNLASLQPAGFQNYFANQASSKHIVSGTGTQFHRVLNRPLKMDEDGVYYLSFLFQYAAKQEATAQHDGAILLVLRGPGMADTVKYADGLRFIFENSHSTLLARRRSVGSRVKMPLVAGHPYMLVGKVVCGRELPDQLLASVFPADAPISAIEPEVWAAVSPTFQTNDLLDTVTIALSGGKATTHLVDRLRIGTTWKSVTSAPTSAQ